MRKLDLGQTTAILANVGVIVGLVLLTIELRQNNALLELQSRTSLTERQVSVLDLAVQKPDVIAALYEERESLTEQELELIRIVGLRILRGWEQEYDGVRRGLLLESEQLLRWRAIYNRPRLNWGTPEAWEAYKPGFAPEFIQFMEENVVKR